MIIFEIYHAPYYFHLLIETINPHDDADADHKAGRALYAYLHGNYVPSPAVTIKDLSEIHSKLTDTRSGDVLSIFGDTWMLIAGNWFKLDF